MKASAEKCELCGQSGLYQRKRTHFHLAHPEYEFVIESDVIVCSVCNQTIPNLQGLIKHYTEQHLKKIQNPEYLAFVKGIAQIEGKRVRADLWLEFESMEEPPSNWDWISLKLENESAVIIYTRERNPFAKFIWKDRELLSSFKVEEDKIILLDLNFVYKIEPIREEVIFNPKHGRPYSEQPINVICQGKKVGFGMRERTYKKMEEQDGKDKVI